MFAAKHESLQNLIDETLYKQVLWKNLKEIML